MKPRVATTSQYRNRSRLFWVARNARFTESIRFRKPTNPKSTNRADPMPTTLLRRSPFSVRLSRAFSSSTFVISALLFHVPNDEDEPELAHRDHERDDHVQEEDDESGPRLADQRHDRHDHDEEKRERHDDGHKRLREHPERLHLLPHLEAVFLLELLCLHEEVRFELAAARGCRDDALEEVRELRGRGALRRLPDRGQDVQAEQLRVSGDPLRLLGDLSVDRLLGELFEDHVDGDVGGGHRVYERHRAGDPLFDLVAALSCHARGLAVITDWEAERVHVREEDWERRDDREDEEERDDRDAQDEQEQRRDERGDDRAHRRERRVHPGDRQVLFGPEPDVGLQEVVLELRVAPGPCLDELPEHAPRDLSLRGQADIDRLGSLPAPYPRGRRVGLLAWAGPRRLRQG